MLLACHRPWLVCSGRVVGVSRVVSLIRALCWAEGSTLDCSLRLQIHTGAAGKPSGCLGDHAAAEALPAVGGEHTQLLNVMQAINHLLHAGAHCGLLCPALLWACVEEGFGWFRVVKKRAG